MTKKPPAAGLGAAARIIADIAKREGPPAPPPPRMPTAKPSDDFSVIEPKARKRSHKKRRAQ